MPLLETDEKIRSLIQADCMRIRGADFVMVQVSDLARAAAFDRETLGLQHWVVKRPLGPCHFGIGTLFMQVEYPFLRYNLFSYVYVLSFYERAKFLSVTGVSASTAPVYGRNLR
jgi:hypothetical protein